MYLLDTNTVSNYLDESRCVSSLRKRLTAEPQENIWISIITIDEILKGILGALNAARKHPRNSAKIIRLYRYLDQILKDLMEFQILPYDQTAEDQLQLIPSKIKSRNLQDCHIAAIALSRGFTVVTSNARDFVDIPGLVCIDWMLEANP